MQGRKSGKVSPDEEQYEQGLVQRTILNKQPMFISQSPPFSSVYTDTSTPSWIYYTQNNSSAFFDPQRCAQYSFVGGSPLPSYPIGSVNAGYPPLIVPTVLCGQIVANVLWDTGAAVSLIKQDVLKKLVPYCVVTPVPSIGPLTTAGGSPLWAVGAVQLSVCHIPWQFLVVNTLAFDVIIGHDFIKRSCSAIDFCSGRIYLHNEPLSPEQFAAAPAIEVAPAKVTSNGSKSAAAVAVVPPVPDSVPDTPSPSPEPSGPSSDGLSDTIHDAAADPSSAVDVDSDHDDDDDNDQITIRLDGAKPSPSPAPAPATDASPPVLSDSSLPLISPPPFIAASSWAARTLCCATRVTVPPGSSMFIAVRARFRAVFPAAAVLIEPLKQYTVYSTAIRQLWIPRQVVVRSVGDPRLLHIQVFNPSDEPLSLAARKNLVSVAADIDIAAEPSTVDNTAPSIASVSTASPAVAPSVAALRQRLMPRLSESLSDSQRVRAIELLMKLVQKFPSLAFEAQLVDESAGDIPDTAPDANLPLADAPPHLLELSGNPRPTPVRSLPPGKLAAAQDQCKQLAAKNIISPSASHFNNGVVMVRKKNGDWRMCIDFRRVNDKTASVQYPLPKASDIFEALQGAGFFTFGDLQSAFHQIDLDSESRKWSAFSIPGSGHWEFNRMPFGLKNAGATMQAAVDLTLRGLTWQCVLAYLDDLVVYSPTFEQHLVDVDAVFTRLGERKFALQLPKCTFFAKSGELLGHIVDGKSLRIAPHIVSAVQNVDPDAFSSYKAIESFLGLTTYVCQFLPKYGDAVAPLYKLLRRDPAERARPPFKKMFTTEHKDCIRRVKAMVVAAPALTLPDFAKPFVITTDASKNAIGATLEQECADVRSCLHHSSDSLSPETQLHLAAGVSALTQKLKKMPRRHILRYYAKQLNPAQRNYATTVRELLAIYMALRRFSKYILSGQPVTVWTDHEPLVALINNASFSLPGAAGNWLAFIRAHGNVAVKYTGRANIPQADALTQPPFAPSTEELNIENYGEARPSQANSKELVPVAAPSAPPDEFPLPVSCLLAHPPVIAAFSDADTRRVLNDALLVNPSFAHQLLASTAEFPATTESKDTALPVCYLEPKLDLQFVDDRISKDQLRLAQASDSECRRIRKLLAHTKAAERRKVRKFVDSESDGLLRYADDKGIRVVIPATKKTFVMNHFHCNLSFGHAGFETTYNAISTLFYWKNMSQDIRTFVRACTTCARLKHSTHRPFGARMQYVRSSLPWQKICMDLVGPLPVSELYAFKYVLSIMDECTRYIVLIPLQTKDANEIATAISDDIIGRFSRVPDDCRADNGTEFFGELAAALEMLGVAVHRNVPHRSLGNAASERSHQSTFAILRSLGHDILNLTAHPTKASLWPELLNYVSYVYNNRVHSSTGFAPVELMFGVKPQPLNQTHKVTINDQQFELTRAQAIENLAIARSVAYRNDHFSHEASRERFEKTRKLEDAPFKVGGKVMLRNKNPHKLGVRWTGPFEIVRKLQSPGNFEIKECGRSGSLAVKKVNIDQLRVYHEYYDAKLDSEVDVFTEMPGFIRPAFQDEFVGHEFSVFDAPDDNSSSSHSSPDQLSPRTDRRLDRALRRNQENSSPAPASSGAQSPSLPYSPQRATVFRGHGRPRATDYRANGELRLEPSPVAPRAPLSPSTPVSADSAGSSPSTAPVTPSPPSPATPTTPSRQVRRVRFMTPPSTYSTPAAPAPRSVTPSPLTYHSAASSPTVSPSPSSAAASSSSVVSPPAEPSAPSLRRSARIAAKAQQTVSAIVGSIVRPFSG